jgi:hypothetical protein
VPDIAIHLEQDHARVEINAALLAGDQLPLCLLQLGPTVAQAMTDADRPEALAAVRDLLVGGADHPHPGLQELVPGEERALVVAPEYAFGSGDWTALDAIVRACPRPIVLLAGFGATSGQAVLDWHAAGDDHGTRRHLSWSQQPLGISGAMRVNGGWCWVHDPDGVTHCLVYLKNVLQQAVEAVALDDMQQGRTLLRLQFSDVDLFRLICADLIQPAALHAGSPQARIKAMLGPPPGDRPTLIVGSLLQNGYNQNWAVAIDSLLNDVLAGRRGAVALANIAHDAPHADEAADKWRSLTGVYAPYSSFPKGQANLRATRALTAQGVVGAVVRQTHAVATAGLLSFSPYNPVAGTFIWRGNMGCRIHAAGLAGPISRAPEAAMCEIGRFLKRYPPAQGSAPRLAAGVAAVGQHVAEGQPPAPATLLATTLHGVDDTATIDPDALHDVETISALKTGFNALATLKTIDGVDWQAAPRMTGQLRLAAVDRHLLIWRSPTLSRQAMLRKLAQWRLTGDDHPDLVVFGATRNGELQDGPVPEDRRDDFTMAPPEGAPIRVGGSLAPDPRDYANPRARRRVATLGLGHVADVYEEYEPGADDARVAALSARITDAFGGQA